MQKYTSANTSVNSTKLPKLYGLVATELKGKRVIDYGCGKYFDSYVGKVDAAELDGYDPYNRPDETVKSKRFDVALCSNVLNVIDDSTERANVLYALKELAPTSFITVYEGDGSGIGRATKADCYQLNRKRGDYLPELVEVFGEGNVKWRGGFFECKGNGD